MYGTLVVVAVANILAASSARLAARVLLYACLCWHVGVLDLDLQLVY